MPPARPLWVGPLRHHLLFFSRLHLQATQLNTPAGMEDDNGDAPASPGFPALMEKLLDNFFELREAVIDGDSRGRRRRPAGVKLFPTHLRNLWAG